MCATVYFGNKFYFISLRKYTMVATDMRVDFFALYVCIIDVHTSIFHLLSRTIVK